MARRSIASALNKIRNERLGQATAADQYEVGTNLHRWKTRTTASMKCYRMRNIRSVIKPGKSTSLSKGQVCKLLCRFK